MSVLSAFALATLNALSSQIALVDQDGNIIAVNDPWRHFAQANGAASNVSEGANYLEVCLNSRGRDAEMGYRFGERLRAVLDGQADTFTLEYPCHGPNDRRWFSATVSSFEDNHRRYAVVTHENITHRVQAEQHLIEAARQATLLEERQRISRELHDGVSQTLFSIMTISQTVPRMIEQQRDRALEKLDEIVKLSSGALSEMRVLLLELRPEVIEKTALEKLLEQLLTNFSNRSGIQVEFDHQGPTDTVPTEVQFCFYRIAQECLNNVLKHSAASHMQVSLHSEADRLRIVIKDNGVGFDTNRHSAGIGLNSMHERADEIQATLAVNSLPGQGTQLELYWTATH